MILEEGPAMSATPCFSFVLLTLITGGYGADQSACPGDFVDLGLTDCYLYVTSSHKSSWDHSKQSCEATGGHLAWIMNENEQNAIASYIDDIARDSYIWIGGSDDGCEGRWQWHGRDGNITAISYTNWDQDQPNSYKGNQDCLSLKALNYKWNDVGCNETTRYICQISKISHVDSHEIGKIVKTTKSAGMCPGDFVDLGLTDCYYFQRRTRTWYQSKSMCEDMGGHLAWIMSQQEQYTIVKHIKQNTVKLGLRNLYLWTGGSDEGLEGRWQWHGRDGVVKDISYTNWNCGEPNNLHTDGEDCLSLGAHHIYKWNDALCSERTHSLCQISKISNVDSDEVSHTTDKIVMTTESYNFSRDYISSLLAGPPDSMLSSPGGTPAYVVTITVMLFVLIVMVGLLTFLLWCRHKDKRHTRGPAVRYVPECQEGAPYVSQCQEGEPLATTEMDTIYENL